MTWFTFWISILMSKLIFNLNTNWWWCPFSKKSWINEVTFQSTCIWLLENCTASWVSFTYIGNFFVSKCEKCDECWLFRFQRVQNSCLRLIYGFRRHDQVSHKLGEARWLNMGNCRQFYSLCLFYKIMNDKLPSSLHRKIIYWSVQLESPWKGWLSNAKTQKWDIPSIFFL